MFDAGQQQLSLNPNPRTLFVFFLPAFSEFFARERLGVLDACLWLRKTTVVSYSEIPLTSGQGAGRTSPGSADDMGTSHDRNSPDVETSVGFWGLGFRVALFEQERRWKATALLKLGCTANPT